VSAIDDVMDSLAFANVYAGQPVERREFAVGLNAKGVSAADVDLLADHCRMTVKDGPPAQLGVLVALLRDDRKREARLADLREIASKRASQDRAFGDKPYVPGPTEGEPFETWDHDRQCRMAKCRHDGDRVPMHNLARELGVSETTAELMVARGRVLDQSGIVRPKVDTPAKIEKAEAAGAKRVTDFRERMSIDRKQRERAGGRKPFDWDRMHREEGKILARLRSTGNVDLAEIMRDPCKRGALATLEADGHVLRADAPDAHQCQQYHIARDDAERAEFIATRRRWEQADMSKPRRKATAGEVAP
jgi:hypothetical protein